MQSSTVQSSADLDKSLNAIRNVNLDKAIARLQADTPIGKGWQAEKAQAADKWYRRFMVLWVKYPETPLVPNTLVDEMWHQHILDTRQYPIDCIAVAGELVHHDPYFGVTPETSAQLQSLFEQTNALYRQEFGVNCLTEDKFMDLLIAAKSCKSWKR